MKKETTNRCTVTHDIGNYNQVEHLCVAARRQVHLNMTVARDAAVQLLTAHRTEHKFKLGLVKSSLKWQQ